MEHVLTLVCKLQPTTEQGAKIDALLGAFAEGCNLTNRIVKPSVTSKTTIQGLVYQTLPEQFGLSAFEVRSLLVVNSATILQGC